MENESIGNKIRAKPRRKPWLQKSRIKSPKKTPSDLAEGEDLLPSIMQIAVQEFFWKPNRAERE